MMQTGFPDIHVRRSSGARAPEAADTQSGDTQQRPTRTLLGHHVESDGAGTYAPLATWTIVAGLALAAGAAFGEPAALIGVIVGATVALLLVPFERFSRLLTFAALAPAAIGASAPAWAWVAAGALVAVAVGRSRAPVVVSMNDLERHLSWCRRREEQADVLTARIPGDALPEPAELVRAFRVTDSVELRRRADGYDLTAVLDHRDLDRAGIEQRIAVGSEPVAWGWALFPRAGYTLAVLVESARRSATLVPSVAPATAEYARPAEPARHVA